MRTVIDLPEKQVKALSTLCEKDHISRTEAIRRAVNRFLEQETPLALNDAFGMWKHKKIDSRKLISRLRSEWE